MQINLPEIDNVTEPDQNGNNNGGMNCSFGMSYISTILLAGSLLFILKRKHN